MKIIDYTDAHKNGFYHEWLKDTNESIVAKIDKFFGGWPDGYFQLMFYHGIEQHQRIMKFTQKMYNTDWWTIIITKAQYDALKNPIKVKIERQILN